MALIQLLVTGDTEQRALVEALSAALPQTRDGFLSPSRRAAE